MQGKWNELQMLLDEMKTMKKREYFLVLAVCILAGFAAGMLMSPKKRIMIASNNGNNNNAGLPVDELEECECECDCDCDDECDCECDCGK